MEQYISVPSGALALHAQDFKAYALLRQMAEFPQPGVPLSVAAAQANLPHHAACQHGGPAAARLFGGVAGH